MDDIKDKCCEDCGDRFPNAYAKTVHICDGVNEESDNKILAFLRGAKEERGPFKFKKVDFGPIK